MELFLVSILLAVLSIYAFLTKRNILLYFFLFSSALFVRMHYIQQDPFLHDWDERYHAVVAKNFITNPLLPVLREDPVLPYNFQDWWGNHIWLHKQPLFMWQMALSMKIFGINEFALRLPSAILCSFLCIIILRIGYLMKKPLAGMGAALLFCFSMFSIELTTGAIGMDHNDISMLFYVTCSIWALLEYYSSKNYKWLILVGLFSGLAILVKWLTGLLVYAAFGLNILIMERPKDYIKQFKRLFLTLIITLIIMLPWQIYIHTEYPVEAKYEFQFNQQHLTEAIEGHTGNYLFYFIELPKHFSYFLIPLIISGLILFLKSKLPTYFKIIILTSILTVYVFFTLLATTKVSAYVFMVYPLILLIIGLNYDYLYNKLVVKSGKKIGTVIVFMIIAISVYTNLKYETLRKTHERGLSNYNWDNRKIKIHNAEIYRSLDTTLNGSYIIFNGKSMEDVEALFYSNQNVYAWWPEKDVIDSLKSKGYKIAAFASHGNQILPQFIIEDKDIIIINKTLY
ncbi:MAG: glycosyltransferase family 39 protein [Bacteroidetes bacterium]|nr:glycosyltransferase family 39 protein [Bacteroidota bacterium]